METINPEHKKLRFTRTLLLDKGEPEELRQQIYEYFNNTFTVYEKLFEVINDKKSFYTKPEPLRHPLIFYFGHTATFFVNKLTLAGQLEKRINPKLETMCAVGVDEMDWDDLDESHYEWPDVDEVKEYRKQVREMINKKIQEWPLQVPIDWKSKFWPILMGIEHERIHLETSAVIIRRLPADEVHDEPLFPICPDTEFQGYDSEGNPKVEASKFPKNDLLAVEEGVVDTGKKDQTYGWDNEYGTHTEKVPAFKASKYLVSNYDFLQFMLDGGYDTQKYWTEEGWKWNRATKMTRPLFWLPDQVVNGKQTYRYRAQTTVIDMPWDWPVETNYLESKAYTNWLAAKTGKTLRLPTEDEWYRLRDMIKSDQPNWEFGTVGNINLEAYASSCPINRYQTNGFYDIVGNVWQHTETPFDGYDGFKVHPIYDDFSTPCFDTMHNMIKGGSWVSTGNEALYHARYAFRRHFYQFAGFRYVESENPVIIKDNNYEMEANAVQYLEFHYGKNYFGVENFPSKCAQIGVDIAKKHNVKTGRALELGCAVGRTSFDLAKYGYDEVVGLDLSARFFQLAVKLKEQGKLRYAIPEEGDIVEFKETTSKELGYEDIMSKVMFYQQDASNLDLKKFNSFDLVLAINLIDRMKYPKSLLKMVHQLLNPKGILIIASPNMWDASFTDKSEWIGGYKKDGENYSTYNALKDILGANFNEIEKPMDLAYI